MALTQDQIFMLAQLADWAGSKMSPDNPFAGYASQYVQATNFAKLLQQAGQQPKPEEKPEEEKPEEETSALAPPNPFSMEGSTPLSLTPPTPETSYMFENAPKVTPEHYNAVDPSWLFTPGVKATITADEENNLTYQRKVPAGTKVQQPTNMATASVYNPFLWRG